MQTPSTAQIRTAIEVLKKLGERINTHAEHSVMQLSETQTVLTTPGTLKWERLNKPPALKPSPRN
jgi:hypothetical protein